MSKTVILLSFLAENTISFFVFPFLVPIICSTPVDKANNIKSVFIFTAKNTIAGSTLGEEDENTKTVFVFLEKHPKIGGEHESAKKSEIRGI